MIHLRPRRTTWHRILNSLNMILSIILGSCWCWFTAAALYQKLIRKENDWTEPGHHLPSSFSSAPDPLTFDPKQYFWWMEGLVQTDFSVQILQLVDAFHKDASWNAKKTPLKLTRGDWTFKENASSKKYLTLPKDVSPWATRATQTFSRRAERINKFITVFHQTQRTITL